MYDFVLYVGIFVSVCVDSHVVALFGRVLLHLFLTLDEAVASGAVFIIVSRTDGLAGGRTDGNAFGAS